MFRKIGGVPYIRNSFLHGKRRVKIANILKRLASCGLLSSHTSDPVDGVWEGKPGKFDPEAQVGGYVLQGNGAVYATLGNQINLGTSHIIEFEAILNNAVEAIIGNTTSADNFIATITGNILRYRTGANSIDFGALTIGDGLFHKYKIDRINTTVILTIDDGAPTQLTLPANTDFIFDELLAYIAGIAPSNGTFSYIKINGNTFDFQETDGDYLMSDKGDKALLNSAPASSLLWVRDDRARSTANDNGYSKAQALGDNLVQGEVQQGIAINSVGDFITSANAQTTKRFTVEAGETYSISNVPTYEDRGVIRFEDKHGNFTAVIVGGVNPNFIAPTNAKFAYYYYYSGADGAKPETVNLMINKGASALPYEAWEGYYYDQTLLNPIPDGINIPAITNDQGKPTGEVSAWVDDGTGNGIRATAVHGANSYLVDGEYVNYGVKRNVDVNNGSFDANGTDNYLDTVPPTDDIEIDIWGKFNNLSATSDYMGSFVTNSQLIPVGVLSGTFRMAFGSGTVVSIGTFDINPHKWSIRNKKGYLDDVEKADFSSNTIATTSENITLFALNRGSGTIDSNTDFTMYKARVVDSNGDTHIWDFNPNNDEAVVYTINGVVQTAPTIQGTVTSDQWSQYGYIAQKVIDKRLVDADPAQLFTDQTDLSAVVGKIVPIQTIIDSGGIINNQYFFDIVDSEILKMGVFEEPLVVDSDCYNKAIKEF